MTGVQCRRRTTQIARVLDHTLRESNQRKIGALVYVGDCCEEPREHLVPLARRLADLEYSRFHLSGRSRLRQAETDFPRARANYQRRLPALQPEQLEAVGRAVARGGRVRDRRHCRTATAWLRSFETFAGTNQEVQ